PHEPWRYGDDALRMFRQYPRLRSRLGPYVAIYGWQASEDGVPPMRPTAMEVPDDPAGYALHLHDCLGPVLLVSPGARAAWVVATPASSVLRRGPASPATWVSAEGKLIARVDAAGLERSEAGWTVDDRVVVVKARARRIEIR